MTPKKPEFIREHELFRYELVNMIDQRHALVLLADRTNWQTVVDEFGGFYAENRGRPGVPIRLMVGLHYLKHAFNL